jgi:hypothetical protein
LKPNAPSYPCKQLPKLYPTMKILVKIFTFVLLIIALTGCDKEPERPDYYFRFRFNGVQKEFRATNDSNIVFIEDGGLQLATFNMVSQKNPAINSIYIGLRTTEAPQVGVTYELQVPVIVQGELSPQVTVLYFDENGKAYLASLLTFSNPGARDDATVTFTEISREGSIGTFDALVFEAEDETSEISNRQEFTITGGEFYLPNLVSLR